MSDIKKVLITETEIQEKISELAKKITTDYKDKDLLLVGILKGAIVFMADLMREIKLPLTFEFMDIVSYEGSTTTGEVRILKDLSTSVEGKDILIVEDIIDTGLTLNYLTQVLKSRGAHSVSIVTLLSKPKRRRIDIFVKYVGFEIPDEFVIGYGMDFNEKYRNLPNISILDESAYL
ncbi:MAG: hypoxanthine phosphoribosyltransferase [Tissierellia bacterium]|nr:hypoxanthine phosphoribosyltransferase [Tissierellia bacterium]